MACPITKGGHNNESKHSEMGPVRQNPTQRTVRSVQVCALHCAQLLCTILHRTDLMISLLPSSQRKHAFNHIRQVVLMFPHERAHCHHLAKTTESPISSGDVILCEITLTTECYYWVTIYKTVCPMLSEPLSVCPCVYQSVL